MRNNNQRLCYVINNWAQEIIKKQVKASGSHTCFLSFPRISSPAAFLLMHPFHQLRLLGFVVAAVITVVAAAVVTVVAVECRWSNCRCFYSKIFFLFCAFPCHLRTALLMVFFSYPLNFRYHVGRVVAELSDNEQLKLETISQILVSSDSKKN